MELLETARVHKTSGLSLFTKVTILHLTLFVVALVSQLALLPLEGETESGTVGQIMFIKHSDLCVCDV